MNTPTKEEVIQAYNKASKANQRDVMECLESLFGTFMPITNRVKCFADAVVELGNQHPLVKEFKALADELLDVQLRAFLRLRIIVAALNEDWTPSINGERYYVWLSQDKQTDNKIAVTANSGKSSFYSYYCPSLYLKSKQLADYCGKQFLNLWISFLFTRELFYDL